MELGNKKNIWKYLDFVLIIISLILSFFAYRIITSYYAYSEKPLDKIVVEQEEKKNQICSDCVVRKIDGVLVPPGKENLFPVAVVIENHTEARPQAGLASANLVIEAEVEGGITRFLAFFASQDKPDRIGPIRSARPYFVDWSRGLSSLYVHVGGSPEALVKIIKENVLNLNEFYNEKYFWRDGVNDAPHNVFTSGENIEKYLEKKGLESGDFISWEYKEDFNYDKRGNISNISIDYKRDYYGVDWKYNKEENAFIRYTDDEIHLDENGDLIKAKNIVIAFIESKVLDAELRLELNNIGRGESLFCNDGICQTGEWEKKSSSSRMRFYDDDDNELKFNRGVTWIEIVSPTTKIVY